MTTPLERMDASSPLHKHTSWFYQSLRAASKSAATCDVYIGAVVQYDEFAKQNNLPRDLAAIERDHIERFMLNQLSRLARASAAARYSGLRSFFTWAVRQGQIEASPMAGMSPPQVPDDPPATLTREQITSLFRACEGRAYKQRRDNALLRFLLETGCRRSEVVGIKVADLDLTNGVAHVLGKGNRKRVVSFGPRTSSAIYAYLIERDRHRHVSSPFLWLGQAGPLSGDALASIVARRARQAGLGHLNPHRFRHTFADLWLSGGGSEGALMALGGWKSAEIMRRYGRSRAADRAIEESRRLAVGDAF